jgi:DNA-binding transcriptional LysR family regulator
MELPPLKSLRLFAIVARCGSFKLAAQELNVTPGAVSQGIKSLEEWLNVALFARRKPELVLTPAGHDYLPYINDALSRSHRVPTRSCPIIATRTIRLRY